MVKKIKDIYNGLDTIPACDRQIDRRTSCHGITRYAYASRSKNDSDPVPLPWDRHIWGGGGLNEPLFYSSLTVYVSLDQCLS